MTIVSTDTVFQHRHSHPQSLKHILKQNQIFFNILILEQGRQSSILSIEWKQLFYGLFPNPKKNLVLDIGSCVAPLSVQSKN